MEKKPRKNKKQTYFDVQWLIDPLYSDWLKAPPIKRSDAKYVLERRVTPKKEHWVIWVLGH